MDHESLILPLPAADQSGCAGCEIALVWASREDRFAHEIVLRNAASQQTLLASVDGNASMDWPPSPPIQEIHCDVIDGRPTHFGIGRAGTSHWSVSIQAAGDWDGGAADFGSLVFQWACRVQRRPTNLAVRYRSPVDWTSFDARKLRCSELSTAGWAVSLEFGQQTIGREVYGGWDFGPLDFDQENATIQWEYRIAWCRERPRS